MLVSHLVGQAGSAPATSAADSARTRGGAGASLREPCHLSQERCHRIRNKTGALFYELEWESLSQCPTLIYVAGHPLEPAQIPPKKQLEDRLCTKSRNYYRIYTTLSHHITIDLTFSIELFIGLYKENFSRITLPDLGLNWMLTNFCTKYFKVRSTNKVFLLSSSDPSV